MNFGRIFLVNPSLPSRKAKYCELADGWEVSSPPETTNELNWGGSGEVWTLTLLTAKSSESDAEIEAVESPVAVIKLPAWFLIAASFDR